MLGAKYCVSTVGLLLGTGAFVSPANAASPNEAQSTSSSIQGSSTLSADGEPLVEEVVVTAQRRAERQQDVPFTVSTVSASQLETAHISSARQLSAITPGLTADVSGNGYRPNIRGVGSQFSGPGVEVNIATYIDDVYQPHASGTELPGLERIEVLKGPQGTLFGRNALGGAIRIYTAGPTDHFEGSADASFGSYNDLRVGTTISGPLAGDTLTGSFSGAYHRNDGYIKNVNTGKEIAGIDATDLRGKVKIQPLDDLSILVTGHYSRIEDATSLSFFPYDSNTIGRGALGNPNFTASNAPDKFYGDHEPAQTFSSRGGSVKISYDLPFALLQSITAYDDMLQKFEYDSDASPYPISTFFPSRWDDTSKSQELTLSSTTPGRLQWVGGIFLYKNEARYDPIVNSSNITTIRHVNTSIETEALSAFGELTVSLTDALSIVGGVRWNDEKKSYWGSTVPGSFPKIADESWDSVTPRVSVRYQIAPRTNVYATYSEGFSSGGWSPTALIADAVDPETLDSYEIGFKTAGSNYTFNASVYHLKYKNLIAQLVVGSPPRSVIQNAADAENTGAEIDGTWSPVPGLSLGFGAAYNHARFNEFPNAVVNVPITTCPGLSPCGNRSISMDVEGFEVPRSPDFTANARASYDFALPNSILTLAGVYYYNSGFAYDNGNLYKQKQYETVAVNVDWEPHGSAFTYSIWGRNLTDARYFQTLSATSSTTGVAYAEPRWFGMTVKVKF